MNKESFLPGVKSFVIKWGTRVVFDADQQRIRPELSRLIRDCASFWNSGKRFVLVSSGSVALGIQDLSLEPSGELSVAEKQACAAVGQKKIMNFYESEFSKHGLKVAQILLTADDFRRRERFLKLENVIRQLLDWGVLPIVNENDSVSTFQLEELNFSKKSFGDNDLLSSLLASKLNAELLIILSNIQGIFTKAPGTEGAELIEEVPDIKQLSVEMGKADEGGRGGVKTKIEAARVASLSGVASFVSSGISATHFSELFEKPELVKGSFFHPQIERKERKRWIGVSSGYEGVLVINEGAKEALLLRSASLLPVGIVSVQGDFYAGDVVSVQDANKNEIGRGKVLFSSEQMRVFALKNSQQIQDEFELKVEEVINRDDLLVYK